MPIIGVTSFPDIETKVHRTNTTYIKAIRDAGGIPLQLPTVNAEEEAREMLAAVDGLLLPGGPDMNPLLMGEEPQLPKAALTAISLTGLGIILLVIAGALLGLLIKKLVASKTAKAA